MGEPRGGHLGRGILFFAGLGGGIGAAIIVAIALIGILLGRVDQLGPVLTALASATAMGALVGAVFAGGVAVLGRARGSEGLAHWKAAVAGGGAAFVVPMTVGLGLAMVRTGTVRIPVGEFVGEWTRVAWWLLGVGAAAGVGLNAVARRPAPAPDDGVPASHPSAHPDTRHDP